MYKPFDLSGKTAIITGASSPIGCGFGMARALGEAGCNLIITANKNLESARTVLNLLRETGAEVHLVQADVTNYTDAERIRDLALEKFGTIDVLINNAGRGSMCPAEEMDFQKDWLNVLNTDLNGTFIMSQVIGRVMISQKKGSIINISSKSGSMVDVPNKQAAYNVAKAGVNMLTKSLAVEWAPYGIRVNAIAPGNMCTSHTINGEDDAYVNLWKEMNPMKRLGDVNELGGTAVLLASDASSYITGAIIPVDGGYCII